MMCNNQAVWDGISMENDANLKNHLSSATKLAICMYEKQKTAYD